MEIWRTYCWLSVRFMSVKRVQSNTTRLQLVANFSPCVSTVKCVRSVPDYFAEVLYKSMRVGIL